ncbi:MAG: SurA N-terminal domain-containing protein, partial [Bacillota bacterium]
MFEKLRENSKIIVIIVAIAFALSGAMLGFSSFFQSRSQPSPSENEQAQQNEDQSEAFNEPIAEVNGSVITAGEYNNIIQQQIQQMGQFPDSQELEFRYQTLMQLVERELVLQAAKDNDLGENISEEDIDEYKNEILENQGISEEELTNVLEKQGMTTEDFRNSIKEELMIEEGFSLSHDDIEVTDEEIEEEYRKSQQNSKEEDEDSDEETDTDEDVDLDSEEFAEEKEEIESKLREQKRQ